MSKHLPHSVKRLINELGRLPGFGPKSAQRLAIYLLKQPDSRVKELGNSISNVRENVQFCSTCWNIAESDPCAICTDEGRNSEMLCVVEDVLDVFAIEKTGTYNGRYHVLHGVLSPIDAVGPEQLKLSALFDRVANSGIKEIVIATNPSLEGEATALYIQKYLADFDGRLTRIARGLPVGGDLEYADEVTLSRALNGRSEF